MKITPLGIQQKQFRLRFRGFDIQEVDEFLEQMASEFGAMQRRIEIASEEIKALKLQIQEYAERQETLNRAMENSQKVVAQINANARKSAELIIADAEVRAEKILNRAYNRLTQLHDDMSELKRQRVQIEAQIRSIIDTHSKLLDINQQEMKKIDEEDSKVKLLKHP
ncbi:MAG TPA: DivIVA domain-containing protein [Desulfobacterales bacterium]|nr:DivIVA domain-containing protein [Desulfobacterales bacterium]